MNKKEKVKLTADYDGYYEFKYKKGQTGIVMHDFGETAAVLFDGYIDERRKSDAYKNKHGESMNVVEFFAEIPINILSIYYQ